MQLANTRNDLSCPSVSARRRRFARCFALALLVTGGGVFGRVGAQENAVLEADGATQAVVNDDTKSASPPSNLLELPQAQPGDSEFEEAVLLRLNVETIEEINKIVDLTESAITKGLSSANVAAANVFLAGVYKQRVELNMRQLMQAPRSRAAVSRLLGEFLSDLSRSIELDPDLVESYLLKVAILRDRQEFSEALAVVDSAIDRLEPRLAARSKSLEFRDMLSKLYVARSTLQEEIAPQVADLEKAVEVNPTDAAVVKQLLALLDNQQLAEGVDNTEKILAAIDAALEFAPDSSEFVITKIIVLQRANRPEEALAATTQAIEQATSEEIKSTFLRQRAMLHQIAGNQELARADLDAAVAAAQDSIPSILLRARLAAEMKNFDVAESDIEAVLSLDEQNADAILLRADIAAAREDVQQAIKDYRALVARVPAGTPQREELLIKLSLVLWQNDQHAEGLRILDQVIRGNPSNWQAHRLQGEVFLSQGAHAEAVLAYGKAISLMPEEVSPELKASLYNNLAWVLSTSPEDTVRDGARALELALEASELTNNAQAHILSTLAAAYAEVGDFDKAVEFSAKGVEVGTESKSEQLEQLEAELKSFQDKKPWREKQEVTPSDKPKKIEIPEPVGTDI